MTKFSLREAAGQAGTSKSTIFRAIKGGKLSADRTDDGGFAIDPAELFRVYPPKKLAVAPERAEEQGAGHDATPSGTVEPAHELESRLAALDAEVKGLRELLAEVRNSRDEIRQDRDGWRGRAERLLTDQRRPWWRRLAG